MSIPHTSFSANVTLSKPFFCSSDCTDVNRSTSPYDQRTYRVQDDALLAVDHVLALLAREHTCTIIQSINTRHPRLSAPSTGLQSQVVAILSTASVTAQFLFPTFTRRIAASAAVHAALITSAFLPVTGSAAEAPTTSVSALTAAKPSMCAPTCSLTTSPLARACSASASDASGE